MIKNKICGIYEFINTITGEVYVGQSNNITKRYNEHVYKPSEHYLIDKAIQLYGIDNFDFFIYKIIDTNGLTDKEIRNILNKEETKRISELNCNRNKSGFGYNQTDGGNGSAGRPCKESTKNAIRISASNGNRAGEKNGNYGKKHPGLNAGRKAKQESIERCRKTKEERGISMKGENNPMYGVKGDKHPFYGHKLTNEHKEICRQYHLNKIWYHKDSDNKLITEADIPYYTSLGYIKGMYYNKKNIKKRCWVNNNIEEKLIVLYDLDYYKSIGYNTGRLK